MIVTQAFDELDILLASLSSALIRVDANDIIQRWNPAAEHIFGIPAGKTIGKPFLACGIDWNWVEILTRIDECRDFAMPTRWEDIRFKNAITGTDGFLIVTVNPVQIDDKGHNGFFLLAQDITQKKHLESQLNTSSKLESIGELAAGIAHEINTPIQYVGDNTRFIKDAFGDLTKLISACTRLKEDFDVQGNCTAAVEKIETLREELDVSYLMEEIPLALEQTLEGVDRVAHIVKAMKEFSHPGTNEKTLSDINKAIENTVTVTRNEWKYVADMELDLKNDMPPVPALIGELNQVFVNMIVNAAHAIAAKKGEKSEEKGKIRIETAVRRKHAEIRISDDGCGIPVQNLDKIFNPFFTTKEVGRGSGQGLAISYNVIVKKHSGELTVNSKVGAGSTFVIRLPLEGK